MKLKDRRRPHHNRDFWNSANIHEESAEAQHETFGWSKIRCSATLSIEHQDLRTKREILRKRRPSRRLHQEAG